MKKLTSEQQLILDVVMKHSEFTKEEICSASRDSALIKTKHLLMYLYRECLGMSLVNIGNIMQSGDLTYHHSTILTGCRRAKDRLREKDTAFCYLHNKVVQDLINHGIGFKKEGESLIIRYPKGYRIHDVVKVLMSNFKELNYEFV
jgi:chromosomal replication initiation ATPase DnaA